MWTPLEILRDLAINLFAGIIIFIVALRWPLIRSLLTREHRAFGRLFGRRSIETGKFVIALDSFRDLRLLQPAAQQQLGINPIQVPGAHGERFFKTFPDGHITWFSGPIEELVPYCSARAAAYLLESFRRIRGVEVQVVSDLSVAAEWNGTFITIGSSYSNSKTDDIKLHPDNPWLLDDKGSFTFKDGRQPITPAARSDKGMIMRLRNPFFEGYSVIVCAGLGEWGTSGAAWFLATRWRRLSRRFSKHPFLLIVNIVPGTDQSAQEILSIGRETLPYRILAWFRHARP